MFYLICIQGQGYNNVAASSKCSFCSTTEELATRCRGSITVGSFTFYFLPFPNNSADTIVIHPEV